MNRKAFERWRLWLGAAVLVWAVGGADPEDARAEAASRIPEAAPSAAPEKALRNSSRRLSSRSFGHWMRGSPV